MKKTYAIYFSPTMGTKKYIEAMAKALDEDFVPIDLTTPQTREKEYSFGPEDLVVIGAPVYAGRLPLISGGLFEKLQGNQTPVIIAVTYGNREFDDALLEAKDICEAKGFVCVAAAGLLAEHTYSSKLAGGRPDEKDLEEAAAFAQKAKKLWEEGKGLSPEVPGNRPYKESMRLPMKTEAGDRCTECGLCAENCPVGAIENGPAMNADGERCIGCLACVKRCPRSARLVCDPALAAIREKLEPNLGGVHKENRYYIKSK